MGLRCKRCGGEEQVKNGLMRGKQRFLCKGCGLNFTDTPARGKPLAMKAAAVLLYVSGLSMNRTAKLLGVSTPTVQAWLEQFAQAYAHHAHGGHQHRPVRPLRGKQPDWRLAIYAGLKLSFQHLRAGGAQPGRWSGSAAYLVDCTALK